jgi:1-acyl-sn-glycerol-3-phosphate acyltransferase
VGLIGTDDIQPVDKKMPRLFRRVTVRFGEPLDASRYLDFDVEHLALRELTDEVMYEIGQALRLRVRRDTYADEGRRGPSPIDVAPARDRSKTCARPRPAAS